MDILTTLQWERTSIEVEQPTTEHCLPGIGEGAEDV